MATCCVVWSTTVVVSLFALLLSARGAEEQIPIEASRVLTNLAEIWSVPESSRSKAWRIRTEFLVYYHDSAWACAWGECGGEPGFLPLGRSVTSFQSGQRVRLDGLIVPEELQVLWERSRYEVIQGAALPPAMLTHGRLGDIQPLQRRWVELEGLVDRQATVDADHIKLNVLAEGRSVVVYAIGNATTSPNLEGAYVRLKGVCSVNRGSNKNSTKMELWVPDSRQVEVLGQLDSDSRFVGLITSSDQFGRISSNELVRVTGTVRGAEAGKSVTLWDATGQVEIRTSQTKQFVIGQMVEAIGYPAKERIFLMLREGLVRPLASAAVADRAPERPAKLCLAGQVRELRPEDANSGIPVELEGILLGSQTGTPFVFIQDASGGVRVHWTRPRGRTALEPGTIVRVQGVTARGEFCPVITNAVVEVTDFMDLPEARFVTLEQALTGVEEGQWAEMGGYVREVVQEGKSCRLKLTTTAGEFEALIPGTDWMASISGSVVRLRGVCTAICNKRGHLKGIQLWVPNSSLLQPEEAGPADPFELPLHAVGKLRQFNPLNSLHRRVRTAGTVLLHRPGRYLYLQDGGDGLFVLSRGNERLSCGDRVEIVGFPGNLQGKFVLREADYRRVGTGKEPTAAALPERRLVDEDLESRLVKGEGRLVEAVERENGVSLMVERQGALFEAVLEGSPLPAEVLQVNSRLALVGVYEIQRDEYGHPRSYRLRLRSGQDVQVLQPAPWWTAGRLLWIVLATLSVFLVALFWGMTVSRKNALLRNAQVQLEAANRTLESRVSERTRELHEEVMAKETARHELAEAQERLMLASRQAGMAEVATSVLHNVGNVLNSVNVSATFVRDMVRKSKGSNLGKVAGMLREHQGNLDQFLGEDAKGQQLISYLESLGEHLDGEKERVIGELKGLTANVEHIKEVVAMQQTYARAGGVHEVLKPTEVVEDALRMQAASLQRHAIEIVREFADLPAVTIDRHKVLQILNNLLQNAKWACEARTSESGRVTVRVAAEGADWVQIEVTDNGVGIAPESLTRIFSLGFTTRENGHGFGLHSAALAAKEMGGSLAAQSEGPGKGATFVLKLPLGTSGNSSSSPPSAVAVRVGTNGSTKRKLQQSPWLTGGPVIGVPPEPARLAIPVSAEAGS